MFLFFRLPRGSKLSTLAAPPSAAAEGVAQDANAEANLGGALAETGNWKEARAHLERALSIDPNNTLARQNLEQVRCESPGDN
jgi:Flp pilus assembly protein TadD